MEYTGSPKEYEGAERVRKRREHSGSIWTKWTLAREQSGRARVRRRSCVVLGGILYTYTYLCRPSCVMGLDCTVVKCRLAISLAHVKNLDVDYFM